MKIPRAAAEHFYAQAFAVCHIPDRTAGRWLSTSRSNLPISVTFIVTTSRGDLEVGVTVPEWIVKLGFGITLRFPGRPDIFPAISGQEFDRFTGKWNIHAYGRTPDAIIAELQARLDWAQGLEASRPAPATTQSELQLTA